MAEKVTKRGREQCVRIILPLLLTGFDYNSLVGCLVSWTIIFKRGFKEGQHRKAGRETIFLTEALASLYWLSAPHHRSKQIKTQETLQLHLFCVWLHFSQQTTSLALFRIWSVYKLHLKDLLQAKSKLVTLFLVKIVHENVTPYYKLTKTDNCIPYILL